MCELAEDVRDTVMDYLVSPICPPPSFARVSYSRNLMGKVSHPMGGVWWTLDDVTQWLTAVLKYHHVQCPYFPINLQSSHASQQPMANRKRIESLIPRIDALKQTLTRKFGRDGGVRMVELGR